MQEIYDYINERVISLKSVEISTQNSSAADELKKFKELLDMGVITQEEFDAKKKSF